MSNINLSKLLQSIFDEMGELHEGTATGGSTSTVIDLSLNKNLKPNAVLNGLVFITHDAAGLGNAPEDQWAKISSYDRPNRKFNLSTTLTQAVVAGDKYAYVLPHNRLEEAVRRVNQGIRAECERGYIPLKDDSLVAEQGKYVYDVLVDWARGGMPIKIEYLLVGTDNDPFPIDVPRGLWDYIPALPGSFGQIKFNMQIPAGRTIRVWYRALHPEMHDYDDVLLEGIHPELAKWAAVVQIYSTKKDEEDADKNLAYSLRELELTRQRLRNDTPLFKKQSTRVPPTKFISHSRRLTSGW